MLLPQIIVPQIYTCRINIPCTAYVGNKNNNYSISYNPGKEGSGLTADQLNSLVNCIQ